MLKIEAIQNDADLDAALERIGELLGCVEGSPEYEELDALSELVIAYEAIHYPILAPSPNEAIECRMEDLGLSKKDLIPCIGSREDVDDILTGRREITPAMAESLHQLLGIDTELLLQEPAAPRG